MPNICITDLFFTSNNKADMLKLYMKALNSMRKNEETDNKDWVGNIFIEEGYKYDESSGDWDRDWIKSRGTVNAIELIGGKEEGDIKGIYISEDMAWSPNHESFEKMVKEKYPGMEVFCYAEEPGWQIYMNNDVDHKYFKTRYVMDTNEDGIEYYDYDQEDQVINRIATLSGVLLKNIKEFNSKEKEIENGYKEKMMKKGCPEDECYISFHEFRNE